MSLLLGDIFYLVFDCNIYDMRSIGVLGVVAGGDPGSWRGGAVWSELQFLSTTLANIYKWDAS